MAPFRRPKALATISPMKRKEFAQLVLPLTDKLYQFAWTLIPDDLQAEQLVIDSLNAYLLKERKSIFRKELDFESRKDVLFQRRHLFKGLLKFMADIGVRRAGQLSDQMELSPSKDFTGFYSLDPKVRFVIALRYEAQFSAQEIEEIIQVPKFEVIEKVHNGRFLLLSDLNKGVSL